MAKINKALDYGKLLQQQAQGKLLKKALKFPLMVQTKYDGNYTATEVIDGAIRHITSGGLYYTHTDKGNSCYQGAQDGYYLAERIGGEGVLGDRVKCNLRGPKNDLHSTGHSYKVFHYLTIDEWNSGKATNTYEEMYKILQANISKGNLCIARKLKSIHEVEQKLRDTVNVGYEGLMLIDPDWKWEDTKSRKIGFCKLKSRPTADLVCTGVTEGEGKYEGLIGALVLKDSDGRTVNVGSGLSDMDRNLHWSYFVGRIIEIEYEQIIDTYIQPSFIQIRKDKGRGDID